ncbi:MAG: MAPEG family protein [Deltaproteobacteria bacterium]|nr:MAG: MAPEG family protein [Deltaproteobacteria bacterium]
MATICIALLALLLFGLGLAVSLTRGSAQRIIGYSDDPTDRLHKLCRAHGNAAEYVPILALLIYILGARGPAAWITWTFVAATVFRYLHAAGMIFPATLAAPNPMRFLGALGTYLAGLVLAIALLVS